MPDLSGIYGEKEAKMFSCELKKARKGAGLTRGELAKRAGISINSVINYENGRRIPTVEILVKLSDALKVNLWDVVTQEQLADRIGCSTMTNRRIETGVHIPDWGQQAALEKALCVDSMIGSAGLSQECKILTFYRLLNENGKKEALLRLQEMTEIPKYIS